MSQRKVMMYPVELRRIGKAPQSELEIAYRLPDTEAGRAIAETLLH